MQRKSNQESGTTAGDGPAPEHVAGGGHVVCVRAARARPRGALLHLRATHKLSNFSPVLAGTR